MTSAATRQQLETRLIEKAWKDPAFKEQMISDPKGMLEQYLGQKLPDQVKIYVHPEDAHTLHFTIPPAPSNVTELSDEELEKVAGGTDLVALILATALASAGAVVGGTVSAAVGGGLAGGGVKSPW